ncbi:MAG TPA: transcriptional regulator, partial [Eubacterium sp.]|nr:transcriptional regulator [Eubacterium sp.]
MIKLKTFGSFTVGNDLTSVQEGAWRSKKLEKLFVYLAINRNRGVCIEDISKAIWQVE